MTSFQRRNTLLFVAISALSTWASGQNAAPTPAWPTKTVRIIVGFPGGSSPDLTARTLAEPLSKALGQPVIVENKVGAGGNIGADYVAKATDNHTLGLMINGNMTTAKLLNPKLAYDPLKDLQPVSLVGVSPLVLTAPLNAPGATAAEFFNAAKQAGDSWSYGSPGVGTIGHIGMELLKSRTGMKVVHVPFPGYAQVASGLVGGLLQLSMLPPAQAIAQVKGGKLRAIGVTSSGRSSLAPDYPSMSEAGVPNFNLEIWNAVAAPKNLPAPVVAKLSKLVSEISRSPEVRQKLFQQGWQVVGSSPEGLANRIQADTALFGGVIKTLGVSSD
ncbi:tripartite tricarboxylate transporter substrate binding protein [Rhodoferax sp. U11-2br]|uniref:Bug family tripartite tricarboxylate transporter substrate binding protein n=1 Tax=Rhodoferax sp. U11-2br TaxID=2838878 RepID=UPI001BE523C7|nr:tripartite tricarboxylate transporter substrate binding protein [Rhodoferax sp. U11-2br]MBT3065923.1 tripartite tricarboxylate transporter substrate binding protein [Rhodoferax sp. U11-2br]